MKMGLKLLPIALICLIFTIGCRKAGTASTNTVATSCISEAAVTPASLALALPQAQLTEIDHLFQQNNLPTANQQFFSIDSNYFQPQGYPANVDQTVVLSYRWYNNLPVFRWNDNITFYNDVFQPQASIVFNGTAPGPDTAFRQSLASLQTIWQNNFMKVGTYGGAQNDTTPTHPNASYRDSCLIAKRGYIDAGYFNAPIDIYTGELVKAWVVTPENGNYPMVIIADSTGAAWPSNIYFP